MFVCRNMFFIGVFVCLCVHVVFFGESLLFVAVLLTTQKIRKCKAKQKPKKGFVVIYDSFSFY